MLYLHTLVKIQKDLIKANDRIISGITFVAQYFGFMSTTTNGTVYLIVQKKDMATTVNLQGKWARLLCVSR